MPVGQKIAPVSEEDQGLAEHHVILSAMVTAKQEKLKELQHEETLTTTNIQRLKRDQEEMKAQQGILLQRERDAHNKQLAEEALTLKKVEAELNQRDANLQQWEQDLKAWEKKVEPIKQAEEEIAQSRIDIEQLRVSANDLMQSATHLQQQYEQRMAECIEREQAVTRTEEEQHNRAVDLQQSQERHDANMATMTLQHENILKVQQEIDPKLKALSEKDKEVSEKLARAEAFHAEAGQKHAENQEQLSSLQALSARLEAKEKVLTEKEIQLENREKDLQVKATVQKAA